MSNPKESAIQLIRERFAPTIAARTAWYVEVRKLLQEEEVYIWGTGQLGVWVPLFLHSIGGQAKVFVDNDAKRWGRDINGIPCISPADIPIDEDPLVIIGVGAQSRVVAEQLSAMGVERVLDISDFRLNELFESIRFSSVDDIVYAVGSCFDILADDEAAAVLLSKLRGFFDFEAGFGKQRYYEDVCRGDQYFQDDLIRFTEESVLVDAGAYTGDTMQDFLRRGYPFRKYIAYELSRRSYEDLRENVETASAGTGKILAYNYGVGEREEIVLYDDAITGNAISKGGIEGQTIRLSDHLRDMAVSFIKMDIEGAEMGALRGAEELICRCRPDLAICTYHSISDLWEIPLYIHSIVPEYRLYLRHHTPVHYETVCYAVI